jgi:L-lactate dehydrogenase complex protein LldE
MRHFLDVFQGAEVICVPSASCVSMIRDHFPAMAEEAGLQTEVADLLPRVFEFTELLTDKLGITDTGATYPHTVTLHTSCHSLRSLHIGDRPQRLLKSVRGLTLIELPANDQCCGFGGTFAIKNADVSTAMLSEKMQGILETGAAVCTAGDNSCLMHIGGGLTKSDAPVRCVHIAEILAS